MRAWRIWLAFVVLSGMACERQSPNRTMIFAAASLVEPMTEIAARFDSVHAGHTTRLNFAASSVLARQIEQAAPADVFVSASSQWTLYLARRGQVDSLAVAPIARNLLVVIADPRVEAPRGLRDLLQPQYWPVAIGDPTHVPLGQYAMRVLTHAGLWNDLQPHLVPAMDADAAVAIVERGEAPTGIAYRNEAVDNPHVHLAFEFPDSLQPDIVYTASIVSDSRNPRMARAFVNFLTGEEGQAVLQRHQFLPLAAEATPQ